MTKVSLSRFALLTCLILCRSFIAGAQTPAQIIAELRKINQDLADIPGNTGQGKLITYKAMNIFLSNKVSSYLSDKNDLSLYKNYVNINAATGLIAVNHNFHQPVDGEDYVRSFLVAGARVNFANAYAARFSNSYPDNQLGFMIQQVWMGRPVTKYDLSGSQKGDMDARRALLLQQLSAEITGKAAAYQTELAAIDASQLPGQNLQLARAALLQKFYAGLRQEYLQKFAAAQSELLINSCDYKVIKDNWTILGVYLPVIAQKYEFSNSPVESHHYSYPIEIAATHTRFWDAPGAGRIFFSLAAGISVTNAVNAGQLVRSPADGTYTGEFNNYLTPVASGKLVYLPRESHVGISFRLEKNFGNYRALNGVLGIPIVLIDKKGVPAVNFECQLIFDRMNRSSTGQLPRSGTFAGLTVGIPFSKVVY